MQLYRTPIIRTVKIHLHLQIMSKKRGAGARAPAKKLFRLAAGEAEKLWWSHTTFSRVTINLLNFFKKNLNFINKFFKIN